VSGLKAWFNFLEEQDSRSLFLHFAEKRVVPASEIEGDESSFKDFVISSLQRLENRIDFLIRHLQRAQFGKPYEFQSDVLDIGGGGLSLSSTARCPTGALLDLCVVAEYGNSFSLYAIGKVQRVDEQVTETGEVRYDVGVQFIEINEEDRESLLRTIFDLDRKQKRRTQTRT